MNKVGNTLDKYLNFIDYFSLPLGVNFESGNANRDGSGKIHFQKVNDADSENDRGKKYAPDDNEGGSHDRKTAADHKIGYVDTSWFGGLLTLLGIGIIGQQTILKAYQIYGDRVADFTTVTSILSEKEIHEENIKIGQFNTSLNFGFGLAYFKDDDFDILNNPYIEVKPYRMSTGEVFDEPYSINRCTNTELDRYLKRRVRHWYPNALCF